MEHPRSLSLAIQASSLKVCIVVAEDAPGHGAELGVPVVGGRGGLSVGVPLGMVLHPFTRH